MSEFLARVDHTAPDHDRTYCMTCDNDRANAKRETVHTWADGFGVWHARVSFPSPGYGPAYLAAHATRIRAKARAAIRREILAREAGPVGPVRVTVEANRLDSLNLMHSLTFGEVTR